jgi:hypothetical protein
MKYLQPKDSAKVLKILGPSDTLKKKNRNLAQNETPAKKEVTRYKKKFYSVR